MFGELAADEGEEGGGVGDEGRRLRDWRERQRGVEVSDALSLMREIEGGECAWELGAGGSDDHCVRSIGGDRTPMT